MGSTHQMGADRKCKSKNYERECVFQHPRIAIDRRLVRDWDKHVSHVLHLWIHAIGRGEINMNIYIYCILLAIYYWVRLDTVFNDDSQ